LIIKAAGLLNSPDNEDELTLLNTLVFTKDNDLSLFDLDFRRKRRDEESKNGTEVSVDLSKEVEFLFETKKALLGL
jgi:hypothetical protein